ncbi:MAG: FAD-binding protein [Nitriliruptoraceae bacterium]
MSDTSLVSDIVIVGAGAAGLYTALCLPDHLSITIIDKAAGADGGSSPWAQGGLAAAVGDDDSTDLHTHDTLATGDGLTDPVAARVLAAETPGHVARLVSLGGRFDRGPDGALSLAREGGQSVARSVRRADATGAELVRVLRAGIVERVRRIVGTATCLRRAPDGRIVGVDVDVDGRRISILGTAIVLATGGCGGLWAATTNPISATGDGLSLAFSAGAVVRDVEFMQFHPTALATEGDRRLLLTEALRGSGATLHDASGRRFLTDVHPDAELAPRHVVAHAILEHADGVAWLDATTIGADRLAEEFPTVLQGVAAHGLDLTTQRVPVCPAAHYHTGGVRTDLHGRTSLDGLYACGEVASTGVHGANRMAGNSLAEALVFGARVAAAIVDDATSRPTGAGEPVPGLETDAPSAEHGDAGDVLGALRRAMLDGAGPVRSAAGLAQVSDQIDGWIAATPRNDVARRHALTAARLIVRGATLRTESRGGHQRADHPARDVAWEGVHLEQARVEG